MSTLAAFNFKGHSVRTAGAFDAPLFVAADVCAVLGISDHHDALKRLPESCKGGRVNAPTPSGNQEVSTVNEAGLYRLIFKSRKQSAEEFQTWVTSEVLPAIRKTGTYGVSPATAKALALLRKYEAESKDALLDVLTPADTYGTEGRNGEPRTRFVRGHYTSRWAQDAVTRKLRSLQQEQGEFAEVLASLQIENGGALS